MKNSKYGFLSPRSCAKGKRGYIKYATLSSKFWQHRWREGSLRCARWHWCLGDRHHRARHRGGQQQRLLSRSRRLHEGEEVYRYYYLACRRQGKFIFRFPVDATASLGLIDTRCRTPRTRRRRLFSSTVTTSLRMPTMLPRIRKHVAPYSVA